MSISGAMKRLAACAVILCSSGSSCYGGLITFELYEANPASLDGKPSGTFTVGGITGAFSVNSGKMNGTSSSWGINAEPSGDKTAQIDGGAEEDGAAIAEALTITFDQVVTFEAMSLSLFGGNDVIDLTLGNHSTVQLTNKDALTFTTNKQVGAGDSVVIAHNSGNGVSLDSFQVQNATATPEPSTLALSLVAIGALGLRRFRRGTGRLSPHRRRSPTGRCSKDLGRPRLAIGESDG